MANPSEAPRLVRARVRTMTSRGGRANGVWISL